MPDAAVPKACRVRDGQQQKGVLSATPALRGSGALVLEALTS